MLAIPVEEGPSSIVMEYHVPYFTTGLIGIATFTAWRIVAKYKAKKVIGTH